MRVVVVLAIVGRFLRMFAWAFLPPLGLAIYEQDADSILHFSVALVATLAFGLLFAAIKVEEMRVLHRAEALAVVAFTWLAIALFGAIPFEMAGIPFIDALFESMSGFTTTGATILTDFSAYSRSFFLWRGMTQWFGGLGVIALFVVVLPRLGIAGRQLFFAEASAAPGEAVSPQVRHAAKRLWLLYTLLSLAMIAALIAVDMDPFDAVCNTLGTLPAGGFSPNGASYLGYNNPAAEWITTGFMIISGMSYPLLYVTLTRKPRGLFRDGEFLLYFSVIAAASLLVAGLLVYHHGYDLGYALRAGAFQVASLISSTGFASEDFNLWGDASKAILVFVMIVGGCAGSAAGGPKVIRHLLVAKHILRELKRVVHPRAVVALKYKGAAISDSVMRAMFTVVVLFIGTYFILGVVLTLFGHDLVTSFAASLATVGNIGPGFNAAGPMGNFAFFGDPEKILMFFGMWLGRLEIATVLALVFSDVWRDLHWRHFK